MINYRESQFIQFLSEQEICELHEAFNIFDDNSNGTITSDKLFLLLNSLKIHLSKNEFETMIKSIGVDKNNQINFAQFLKIIAKRVQKNDIDEEKYFRKLFDSMDRNKSGRISIHEIRYIVMHSNQNITEREIEMLIGEADSDGDGLISYDEFLSFMKN